jgi:hypothetical protein
VYTQVLDGSLRAVVDKVRKQEDSGPAEAGHYLPDL